MRQALQAAGKALCSPEQRFREKLYIMHSCRVMSARPPDDELCALQVSLLQRFMTDTSLSGGMAAAAPCTVGFVIIDQLSHCLSCSSRFCYQATGCCNALTDHGKMQEHGFASSFRALAALLAGTRQMHSGTWCRMGSACLHVLLKPWCACVPCMLTACSLISQQCIWSVAMPKLSLCDAVHECLFLPASPASIPALHA